MHSSGLAPTNETDAFAARGSRSQRKDIMVDLRRIAPAFVFVLSSVLCLRPPLSPSPSSSLWSSRSFRGNVLEGVSHGDPFM